MFGCIILPCVTIKVLTLFKFSTYSKMFRLAAWLLSGDLVPVWLRITRETPTQAQTSEWREKRRIQIVRWPKTQVVSFKNNFNL